MKKAVESGVIQHVSASQIKVFTSCRRQWWYEKCAGLRPPQTAAQAAGDAMHKQLDSYYKLCKDGLWGDAATLLDEQMHPSLKAALCALPKPGPDVLSEYPHDYNLDIFAANVPVVGRIDLLHFAGPRTPTIIDLKSKSSLSTYVLTPEQLAVDIQLTVYGKFCVEKHDAQAVTYMHLNVLKSKPKFKPVSVTRTASQILHNYAELVVTPVEEMKRVALLTSVDSLPTMENETSNYGRSPCESFGGCPFKSTCFKPMQQSHTAGANMFDELPAGPSSIPTEAPLVQPATSLDLVLFIDCLPMKGIVAAPLEDLIARHSAPICQLNKVTDVREIDFGKGTRALIASVLKDTLVGNYTCSSQGLGGLVSEALLAQAKVVIRGCR